MTEIVFHHDVTQRLNYCARLLRQAYLKEIGVIVVAEPALLTALSQELHRLRETELIPHFVMGQSASVRQASPLWLLDAVPQEHHHFERLLNLLDEPPKGFEGFEQLIEVVDLDASTRQHARLRLEHYKSRGYPVTYHKAST